MVNPEMESVACPVCGGDQSQTLRILEDYNTRQPGKFTLVKCLVCGLVYLNPRPVARAMAAYYPQTYDPHHPTLIDQLAWHQRWPIQYGLWRRCQPLRPKRSPGRILDIGCGAGHFLAMMRGYGWQVTGIDPSPQAVEFARQFLKLEVYACSVEQAAFPEHTFDAVTMWDSLEHLRDPRSALLEVNRWLKPQGSLLLRVPALDSLDARVFGTYWAGLDAPRHLCVFSRATLVRLLADAGFAVKRLGCMSGSHASFVASLRFLFNRAGQSNGAQRALLAFLTGPVGRLLSAPYFFAIDRLLLGPEITVLAGKQNRHD